VLSPVPLTPEPRRSAAIAIVTARGGVPTAAEVATVHAQIQPELARLGYVLATDPRFAEVVVHVKVTPDASGGPGAISVLDIARISDEREQALAARDEFKESSAKAIRSQVTEPR
jgi:hypothetical protein